MKCKCGNEFEPLYRNGLVVSKLCMSCLSSKGKIKRDKLWLKEKKELKTKLKTKSDWKKELQPLINKIARLIDNGQPCIATGSFNGKRNGGHFTAVGANESIRFNLHNIHIQSEHSNSYRGGDNIRYSEGLERIYGIQYLERVRSLKQLPEIKLSESDLIEKISIARRIIKELDNGSIYPPEKRIELREKYNNMIGIYASYNYFFEQTENDKTSNLF